MKKEKKKELEKQSNEFSDIKMNKSSNDLLNNKKEKSFKKFFYYLMVMKMELYKVLQLMLKKFLKVYKKF